MRRCGVILKDQRTGAILTVRGLNSGIWSFPKGSANIGEEDKVAAMREMKEETGLTVNLGGSKKIRMYNQNVIYYIKMVDMEDYNPFPADRNEVDQVKWFRQVDFQKERINCDIKFYLMCR